LVVMIPLAYARGYHSCVPPGLLHRIGSTIIEFHPGGTTTFRAFGITENSAGKIPAGSPSV